MKTLSKDIICGYLKLVVSVIFASLFYLSQTMAQSDQSSNKNMPRLMKLLLTDNSDAGMVSLYSAKRQISVGIVTLFKGYNNLNGESPSFFFVYHFKQGQYVWDYLGSLPLSEKCRSQITVFDSFMELQSQVLKNCKQE